MTDEQQLRGRCAQLDQFLVWFDGFAEAIAAGDCPRPTDEQWKLLQREVNVLANPKNADFISEYVEPRK